MELRVSKSHAALVLMITKLWLTVLSCKYSELASVYRISLCNAFSGSPLQVDKIQLLLEWIQTCHDLAFISF